MSAPTAGDRAFATGLAFAVLAGAPAAGTIPQALSIAAIWASMLALAWLATRASQRLLRSSTAAWLASTIVCTTAAAAVLALVPLAPAALADLPPTSLMLLALVVSVGTSTSPQRNVTMFVIGISVLVLTAVLRGLLPPMMPTTSAALALALLASALALLHRSRQNPDEPADRHER